MTYELAIIEDDTRVRAAVCETLKESKKVDVVLECDSVERALTFYRTRPAPNLILLDINLTGMSGLDGLPIFRKRMPGTEIIVYTILEDQDTIFRAICHGASGYLLKSTPLDQLENHLLSVLEEQGSPVSPPIARRILKYFRGTDLKRREEEKLSPTERTVVQLLVEGMTYKDIAPKIGVTVDGVRYYVKKIYNKLHVNTRNQLTRHFLDTNW